MTKSAAVVGAGVFGRLLALSLGRAGWTVTIFDRHGWDDRSASCFAAAGLLTPAIESIHDISRSLFTLGLRSIDLWSDLIPTLKSHVTLGRQGTIHVGFGQDSALLHELHDKIVRRLPGASSKIINAEQIRLFEPALSKSGFHEALYLPTDG